MKTLMIIITIAAFNMSFATMTESNDCIGTGELSKHASQAVSADPAPVVVADRDSGLSIEQ